MFLYHSTSLQDGQLSHLLPEQSAMKMVLIDSEKAVLRQVSEEYEAVHAGDGWSEIDPVIWYSAMKKGIHKIMEGRIQVLWLELGLPVRCIR